jgi:hypothetical protein
VSCRARGHRARTDDADHRADHEDPDAERLEAINDQAEDLIASSQQLLLAVGLL